MRTSVVAINAACFLLLLLGPSSSVLGQSPSIEQLTVEVVGVGDSYEVARADAVRKAMQQTLPQLVIVERIVSEDALLRDRVLSTSNGFVESYSEKSVTESDLGISVTADISVSASRIRNYLGVLSTQGGEVDGGLLGAAVQRRLAQQQAEANQRLARREIFERVFERWPLAAVNIELLQVQIDPKNPKVLVLSLEQTYKQSFVDLLTDTLDTLSFYECNDSFVFEKTYIWWGRLNKKYLCPYNNGRQQSEIVQSHVTSAPISMPEYAQVCVGESAKDNIHCYLLEDGVRLSSDSVRVGSPLIAFAFYDKNGKSVMNGQRCILAPQNGMDEALGVLFDTRFRGRREKAGTLEWSIWSHFHILVQPINFQVRVSVESLDLNLADKFIAVHGLVYGYGSNADVFRSPLKSVGEPINICDTVDEAFARSGHRAST